MIIQHDITADVARANLFSPIIIAEDDDNSHVLQVQLMLDGEVLDIPSSGFFAELHYQRADGDVGIIGGTISSGKIRIPLSNAPIALDDLVLCEICVNRHLSVISHTVYEYQGQVAVLTSTGTYDSPLRSARFYIDSQMRVITA